MSSKIALAGVVALVALCGSGGAHAADPQHFDFWRSAHLSIGADGKVSDLVFVKKKDGPDIVAQRLDPVVRKWTFEPGSVDGQRMPTETEVSLHLDAQSTADGGYAIKLLYAAVGPGRLSAAPPAYPRKELAEGAEAAVSLLVSIDAAGVPDKVLVENVIGNGSSQNRRDLAEVAGKAAKDWRFQPEKVGGHGVASWVRMPVEFCIDGAASQCARFNSQLAAKNGAMPADMPVALDSKVKLITQVVGTAL